MVPAPTTIRHPAAPAATRTATAGNQVSPHALYELGILKHVEETPQLNNRTASKKLGVSIRLAHALLKTMVSKGLLHVTVIHARRWDYFLTPKGIAEKTRLTMEFLDFSMTFYREARKRSAQLCRDLAESGVRNVSFLGNSELAEIAYLGVQEWGLCLTAVYGDIPASLRHCVTASPPATADSDSAPSPNSEIENRKSKISFLGLSVRPACELRNDRNDAIIICLYDKTQPMRGKYLPAGVAPDQRMHWIFQL